LFLLINIALSLFNMPTVSLFGIIGNPLSHSFSPSYFNQKFESLGISSTHQYLPFELSTIEEFPTTVLANHSNLIGLNVTIPYKQQILAYVHHQHQTVKACGATNCLHINNGIVTAYNTDVIGFSQSLQPLLKTQHTKALVLGNGGATKAIIYALAQLGIDYTIVSRKATINTITYDQVTAQTIAEHQLIINCSPIGMFPYEAQFPMLPYHAITPNHLMYDLIYKPKETVFLQKGKAQGATIKNGYEMLLLQAEASWTIWNS
jgi:shikimate dehydrogenase